MVLASSGFRVNSDLAQLSMITIIFALLADFILATFINEIREFKK